MSTDLLGLTYRLLDETEIDFREIATGAGVGLNWLYKLQQRAIEEPGVKKVQAVCNYLRRASMRRPGSGKHAP